MLSMFFKQLKIAFFVLILFTILTGLIYPLMVTAIAQLFFPSQANGSFLEADGRVIGSMLIGQDFDAPDYFWGRPSATPSHPYNAESSSGSNMGPTNPQFLETVKTRVANLRKANPQNQLIPVDLVTASSSGLDPEISPLAAYYQTARIAKATQLSEIDIRTLIQSQIKNRTFILLGEPRVNVLQLNIALNNLRRNNGRKTP